MKQFNLIILILIFFKSASAQTSYQSEYPVPVLRQMLAASKTDTDKVNFQVALGRAILYKPGGSKKQTDSAMTIADQTIALSRHIHYDEGVIYAMLFKGWCFFESNDLTQASKIVKEALAFSQQVKSNLGMAECYVVTADMYSYFSKDAVPVKQYNYDKAIAIFKKERSMNQLIIALRRKGEFLIYTDHKREAVEPLFEALNISKAIGYKDVQRIYSLIARNSSSSGDFVNGLKYDLLAAKTCREVGDTTARLAGIYNGLAFTYINVNNYSKALTYSLMAMDIAKRHNVKPLMVSISLLLSVGYTLNNKVPQALAVLEKAKRYALDDYNKVFISTYFLRNTTDAKQFRLAAFYAEELKGLLNKIMLNNPIVFRPAYLVLAKYYTATRQIKPAYFYTHKIEESASRSKDQLSMRTAEVMYYKIDSIKGDFRSALEHHLIAEKTTDSTDNVTKAYQISLLQIENETEKKNNDIDALTKQALVKDLALKRNQLIQKVIIAGCGLLVIITVLIYSRYRLKQRSNALLTQQKAEIDRKNDALEQLLEDKDELLEEKDLLLKEVNHRVKNNLQIVMSLLQSQSGYMQNKQAQDAILESQNRVQSIALIHDQLFRTDKVAEIDLVSYIAELVHSLDYSINQANSKVKLRFDVDAIMLDVSQAIPVGIILNEAVTNALKYAFPGNRAGEIFLRVKEIDEQIEISISDNGVGLPKDFSSEETNSLGMTLIQGLASQLKGNFDMQDNGGVTINIVFPLEIAAVTRVAATA